MKKRVLVWSSTPTVTTGFGRQVSLILKKLFQTEKYEFDIVGKDYHGEPHNLPYNITPLFNSKELNKVSNELQQIVMSSHTKATGIDKVMAGLMTGEYDILFVYQDMFMTSPLGNWFKIIKQEIAKRGFKDFKTICYYTVDGKAFPEYLHLAREADIVVTPNKYGKEKIQAVINRDVKVIPHGIEGMFQQLNPFDKSSFKKKYFQRFKDKFIVGWVGSISNPRKNLDDALIGFKKFHDKYPESVLYIHGQADPSLLRCLEELNIVDSVINPMGISSRAGLPLQEYKNVIASLDVLLNTSYSEAWGLPITEAMISGVPILIPENIAMSQEYKDFTWQIKPSEKRSTFDSTALYHNLDTDDLANKILEIKNNPDKNKIEKAKEFVKKNCTEDIVGSQWVNAFNELLTTSEVDTNNAVLFAQYESAGDVLLSTRAFKGIKERHGGKELHYMTHPMYMDIVKGNPYIDKIIPWDGNMIFKYQKVYKPHIDKIKNGNWGTGDYCLAELYTNLCGVEADKSYIECVDPNIKLPEEYLVVHTSGGHRYRTYHGFEQAFVGIDIPIVQIGGKDDVRVGQAIDLRGRLSFRQTAWVIAHSKIFVGVDSFPHHVASALGIPQVSIFTSASPYKTASPETNGMCITPDWLKNCPIISPCHGNFKCKNPCINTIKPQDVHNAIKRVLSKEENKDG